MSTDVLQPFSFDNLPVRGRLINLENSFQTISQQHKYPTNIQHILGEAIAATVMMTSTVKLKGSLSLQYQGQGAISLLLVKCDHDFNMRALCQWDGIPSSDVIIAALQQGQMNIIIQPDSTPNAYQSIVPFTGNDLASSLQYYFEQSEQLPTFFCLAANTQRAAGLMLQLLPDTDESTGMLAWEHVTQIANTLTSDELLQLEQTQILHRLFHQEQVRLYQEEPVDFNCRCNAKRMGNAILTLGQQEANEMLATQQAIVVTCEFCGNEYSFDRIDVANIFAHNNSSDMH